MDVFYIIFLIYTLQNLINAIWELGTILLAKILTLGNSTCLVRNEEARFLGNILKQSFSLNVWRNHPSGKEILDIQDKGEREITYLVTISCVRP